LINQSIVLKHTRYSIRLPKIALNQWLSLVNPTHKYTYARTYGMYKYVGNNNEHVLL